MSSSAMTGIHQGEFLPPTASSVRIDVEIGEYDDGLSAFSQCVRVCSASLTACWKCGGSRGHRARRLVAVAVYESERG